MPRHRSSRPARAGCPRPDKEPMSEQAAKRQAAIMQRDPHLPRHRAISAYGCVCGAWHIGNQPSLDVKIARALGADQ